MSLSTISITVPFHGYREYMKTARRGAKGRIQALFTGKEANFRSCFQQYKQNARVRKHEFDLTLEQFLILTSQNCHYCGAIPSREYRSKQYEKQEPYICNGIDRVNNSFGYVFSNCVPCCKICNYMKRGLTQQEFLEQIRKIAEKM